jgi:hypothetical protein
MRRSAGISLAATLLASAALLPANVSADEAGVKVGVLRCDVGSGVGFIFGSSKDVECLYSPGGDKATEKYVGEIKKYGVDIGYSKSGVMVWAVLAPSADVKAGALAGSYAGATAEAAAGAGAGANVLLGGGNSISLQPLSISGVEGVNVAAGLGVLDLKAAE